MLPAGAEPAKEAALPDGVYTYEVEGQPGTDLRSHVAAAIVGAGYQLLELKGLRPSLEDTFLRVVSQGAEEEEYEEYEDEGEYGEDEGETEEYEEEETVSGRPQQPRQPRQPQRVAIAKRVRK